MMFHVEHALRTPQMFHVEHHLKKSARFSPQGKLSPSTPSTATCGARFSFSTSSGRTALEIIQS